MYNIQKAVSRLNYAPKLKEIQITDIKKGLGAFTPKPDQAVSFAALKTTLKKAGYTLDSASIDIAGTLAHDDSGWQIIADVSGQRFSLEGETLEQALAGYAAGAHVEINGEWKSVGEKTNAREAVMVHTAKKLAPTIVASLSTGEEGNFNTFSYFNARSRFATAKRETLRRAPIRTTTPGLTVFQGGAITTRLSFINQHQGNLRVARQQLQVSASYTPTPVFQAEVEVPLTRTSFTDSTNFASSMNSASGVGFGNIALYGKYRFYRRVKTYGDRQAAVRFGAELPTGKTTAPNSRQANASEFLRQQLTPINGGFSPIVDLAYSQARGRFIYGANAEGILRTARDGYRTGHEVRVNTDAELVVFPIKYRRPTKELFAILETTFVHRGTGRVNNVAVPDSRSTEYYLAPGLQYVATPQLVLESSFQFPVILNTGTQLLRTDRNILIAAHYLF